MLREVSAIAQDIPGLTRRWFRDEYFDLYLWEGRSRGLEEYAKGGRPPTPGRRGAPRHRGRERLE